MIKFVPYEKENCVEVVAYNGENSIGKASFTVEGFNMNFISVECDDDVIIEGLARASMNYAANRNAYIAKISKDYSAPAFSRLGFEGEDVLTVEIPEALMSGCSGCHQ
jgi:hypothetical protein